MFKEYMHIERFGTTEVEGIELGQVYVFPKLDGTNASTWKAADPSVDVLAGSRTRQLSFESDNAGFYAWTQKATNIVSFHYKYPNLRLFGEWLVPHSYKGYREDAWRRFYVFDVMNDDTGEYLSYEVYKPLLEEFGIDFIPPLATIKNGDYERFLKFLEQNFFMIPDGGQPGEGIVLKNYDFYNKFKRQVWAKIVRNEFKELHAKAMGAPDINGGLMNEERLLKEVPLQTIVEKTFHKMLETDGWSSRRIPELFERVFYDIIKEELWTAWKKSAFFSINGKTLKALVIQQIKQFKPELF